MISSQAQLVNAVDDTPLTTTSLVILKCVAMQLSPEMTSRLPHS